MTAPAREVAVHAASDVAGVIPGSIRVRERVIDKVIREASAEMIGVPREDVRVEVSEWGATLAVRVASKLPVPALDDTDAVHATVPVIERVRELQVTLAEEFARLTGRAIRRVSFTVTGAVVPARRRVR